MSNKVYALKRLDKNSIQPFDEGDLIELLDDAILLYTNAIGVVKANENTQEYIPHYAFAGSKLEKYGSVTVLDGPNDAHIAELSLEELVVLLDLNRKAKAKIEDGETLQDEPIVYIESRNNGATWLHRSLITRAVNCHICDAALTESLLEDHLRMPECRNTKLDDDLLNLKLFAVEDQDDIDSLAKTRNIPLEYHPVGFRMCVPKWVEGAINAFRKGRGGYAGLDLHDYLDRIAPDKK